MPSATIQRIHPHSQVRAVDREKLEVDIVASTDKIDSYNSTIDASGWDLEQFKRNPQILWAHDDRGFTPSAGLPVANAIPSTIRIEGNRLLMRLRFTPKETSEFGYTVFRLIADGFLHGLSVGFESLEEMIEDDEDGNRVVKYKRQKLLEVSVVTIPANDDALVVRAREMDRESDIDQIRSLAANAEELAKKAAEAQTIDPAEHAKYKAYFDQKQPINKLASGVLKKFFTKVIGEEPPSDEKEAWTRAGEAVDAMNVTEETEIEPEETVEETPQEAAIETPSESQPAEAPQAPAQKASVLIPLDALGSLPERFREALKASADEALRLGVIPVNDIDGFIDRMSDKLAQSVVSQ